MATTFGTRLTRSAPMLRAIRRSPLAPKPHDGFVVEKSFRRTWRGQKTWRQMTPKEWFAQRTEQEAAAKVVVQQHWRDAKILARVPEHPALLPTEFEGDSLLPPMATPEWQTWADVAAIPADPKPTWVRHSPTRCTCGACVLDAKRKERLKKAFEDRSKKRSMKEQLLREEKAFNRQRRAFERAQARNAMFFAGLGVFAKLSNWFGEEFPEEGVEVAEEPQVGDFGVRPKLKRCPKLRATHPPASRDWDDTEFELVCSELRAVDTVWTHVPAEHAQRSPTLLKKLRSLIGELRLGRDVQVRRERTQPQEEAIPLEPIVAQATVEPATRPERVKTRPQRRPVVVRRNDLNKTVYQPTTRPVQYAFEMSQAELARRELLERKRAEFLKRTGRPLPKAEMQGDEVETVVEEKAGNVVLQEAGDTENEIIGTAFGNLRRYCEANVDTYPSEEDRWMAFASVPFTTSQAAESKMRDYTLPRDAVITQDKDASNKVAWNLKQSVLANPLRARQFFHGDMTIKAVVNSSPFNCGQIMMSWLYRPDLDSNVADRENIYTMSAAHSVILDMGNANSAEMKIPYRSYRPYTNIRMREKMDQPLTLGKLYLFCLNKLNVPSGGTPQVDVTLLIKFDNMRLMGMIPPSDVVKKAEMLPMLAVTAAMKALNQIAPDRNRDNPPVPSNPPHLTPVATSSLAYGTNDVEHLQAMRLDPKGQTPHPESYEDEMTVKSITRKFGLVARKTLGASQASGTQLFCWDASPLLDLKHYSSTEKEGTKTYRLPPVAVISSLFAQTRGTVEYRLDFVCTRFHQARLWMCWVPWDMETELTLEQAYSCAGTFFDLKEDNRSITVQIPYIADRPFWPQRYSTGNDETMTTAPARFCCFVVNRLTYTQAVAQTIDINIYVRAGDDFELAIPCQPTIGLAFNPVFTKASDVYVTARDGYYPYYVGKWRYLNNSTKAILRYGAVSDHIAQFSNLEKLVYYRFKDKNLAETMKFIAIVGTTPTTLTGNDVVFVPVDVGDSYGIIYLGAIQATEAKYYYEKAGKITYNPKEWDRSRLLTVNDTSGNTYYSGSSNAVLVPTKIPTVSMVAEGVREESERLITFENSASDVAANMCFGESFTDLKDLCRRYQPYASDIHVNRSEELSDIDLTFPMLPQGLNLDPQGSRVGNNIRDGPIPIILSGYRFYRGGLRFKFIPTVASDGSYFVQVRPDRRITTAAVSAKGQTGTDNQYNHGYATSCQCTSVNPILTCEVPFYLPGDNGLLQMPSDRCIQNPETSRYVSLGECCISYVFPASNSNARRMTILYSVADDFTAHTFQGFPPMVMISDSKTTEPIVPKIEAPRSPSESEFEILEH